MNNDNNKSKQDRRSLNIFFAYFIYISLYGIVIKLTASNPTLFTIKTYVPELLLGLSIIPQLSKKHKLDRKSFTLIVYLLAIMLLNYALHGATAQSFYWWRDLFIPVFIAIYIYCGKISSAEIEAFVSKLAIYGKLYLIIGLILALAENQLGWEWTSAFYAGHTFYGTDPYTKVLVNQYLGFVRAPGLTGHFTTFAFYSCICLFAILWEGRKRHKKPIAISLWVLLGFATCVLSTNKSAILGLAIVLLITKANDARGRNKIIANVMLVFSGFLFIVSFFAFDSATGFTAAYLSGSLLRFDVWANILESTNFIEVLIPYNMFLYGSGSDTATVTFGISFFDNFYLYILITQGIVGLYLIVSYVIRALKKLRISHSTVYGVAEYIVLFGAIIGLTSNIIQGRAYFPFVFILMAYFSASVKKDAFMQVGEKE